MSDRKIAITIDEQLTRLQSRGMTISDIDHARKVLLSVGYFRMGFYWYGFEIPKHRKNGIHKFRKDTTWEKVEALYDFDDRFRNLLSIFKLLRRTSARISPISCPTITKQTLYGLLILHVRRRFFYSRYNVEEEDVFKSYINTLRIIRNVCAHSHILYDKRLYDGIVGRHELLGLKTGEEISIVGILKLIYYMLRQIDSDKETEMHNSLRSLVNQVEYDSVRFALSRLAF